MSWPRKSRPLLRAEFGEPLARGFEGGVELLLGRLAAENHPRDGVDVVRREHAKAEQPFLDLVKEVRVGLL